MDAGTRGGHRQGTPERFATLIVPAPVRGTMEPRPWRWAFAVAAWLFVAAVVVQVYLAGHALFAEAGWEAHENWVHVFEFLPIVLFAVAWPARVGRDFPWWSLGLFLLTGAQYGLAAAPDAVGALHPVNGVLIAVLGLWLALRATAALRGPAARVVPGVAS